MNGTTLARAIRNCSDPRLHAFQPVLTPLRASQKFGPEHIVHLLQTAAAPARTDAAALLRQMTRAAWRIGVVIRESDTPTDGVDQLYLAVTASGRRYRLGCTAGAGLQVVSVTTLIQ